MNLNKLKGVIGKHAPEILLVMGLTEIVATVVVTSKATLKAADILAEKQAEAEEELKPVEVIKTVAPTYIPSALMLAGTVTTLCLSHHILTRRNAALAFMVTMAQNTLAACQEQILEKFGQKKLEAVQDEVVKKHVEDNPPPEEMLDMNLPSTDGFMLCFDYCSKQYFRSNEDFIRRAFNRTLNPKLTREMGLTYNEYIEEIGGGLKKLEFGDDIVWRPECKEIEPKFTYDTYCGQPLCIVDFWVRPTGMQYRWG